MKFAKTIITILFFAVTACCLKAQELNCDVTINTDQIQATNRSVFETLQEAVREYMNTNHFTNDQYAVNERIDCRLFSPLPNIPIMCLKVTCRCNHHVRSTTAHTPPPS